MKSKSQTFRFKETDTDEIKNFIQNIYSKKHLKTDMNAKILRKNSAFCAKYSCDDINVSIHSSKFHFGLK